MRDNRASILLVEDDEVDIMNVNRAFRKLEINNPLHIARDGVEALELLRGKFGTGAITPMPQLVFLDINMPRMNGLELLREIRADEELKSLIVVMLTTSDDLSDIQATYSYNVAGYIVKPINWEAFLEAMAVVDRYWTLSESP